MIEHELKFALTASMVAEFEQRTAMGLAQAPQRLWAEYFDTPAGDLMAASATLRVRRTAQGHVQTVKATDGSALEQCAWDAAITGMVPEFDALPPSTHPAGSLLEECFESLAPVFETDFQRQVRLVRPQHGVTIEIVCDQGEIRAGLRTERIAEVKVRRKEGSAAAFFHYATQWAALHQAQLLLASKWLRGLQLAGRRSDRPEAAWLRPRNSPPDAPLTTAAAQMLSAHLEHFVANVPAVLSGTGPGAVHQLSEALRRFRAAIRFLGLRRPAQAEEGSPTGDDVFAAWQDLDQRAWALLKAASTVRRADACEAGLLASLRRTFPRDPAVQLLTRAVAAARGEACVGLRQAMASPDLTAFVMRAHAAVAALPPSQSPDQAFSGFAAGVLKSMARRARRLIRRTRQIRQSPEVRVAVARLRISLEACQALPGTSPVDEKALASLTHWHASLGASREIQQILGFLADAVARIRAPAEVSDRAVALLDGCLACAAWMQISEEPQAPLLATVDRLLEARLKPDRADDADTAGAQASRTRKGLKAEALRLSS